MTWIELFILSVVEGVTEYIPVSSTGHMVLVADFFNMTEDPWTQFFVVTLQLGAILAVFVDYWRDCFVFDHLKKIAVAFIPTAVVGFALKDKVDEWLANPLIVVYSLLFGGVIMIIMPRFLDKEKGAAGWDQISYKQCLLIGLAQCLAMIPGVSRSAATILGGWGFGLTLSNAARFSFLLAIPTLGGAFFLKFIKNYHMLESQHINMILVGNLITFVIGFLCIRFLMAVIRKIGLVPFGIYRVILAVLLLLLIY